MIHFFGRISTFCLGTFAIITLIEPIFDVKLFNRDHPLFILVLVILLILFFTSEINSFISKKRENTRP